MNVQIFRNTENVAGIGQFGQYTRKIPTGSMRSQSDLRLWKANNLMFAITTRNKLRSRRFAASMIWAWWRIRRQLARTPGMLAYTTGMASMTEFFTLTLWEKEIDMMAFMSSDDHRDMMWNVRHWSDSFWSMRWKPSADSQGIWNGLAFNLEAQEHIEKANYVGPGYMEAHEVPEKLRPILSNIIRKFEPDTLDVNAIICRVPTRSLIQILRLRRILRTHKTAPDVVRYSFSVGFGECFVLIVWKSNNTPIAQDLMASVMEQFPNAWATQFLATDFEIGHWDHLRFRES